MWRWNFVYVHVFTAVGILFINISKMTVTGHIFFDPITMFCSFSWEERNSYLLDTSHVPESVYVLPFNLPRGPVRFLLLSTFYN